MNNRHLNNTDFACLIALSLSIVNLLGSLNKDAFCSENDEDAYFICATFLLATANTIWECIKNLQTDTHEMQRSYCEPVAENQHPLSFHAVARKLFKPSTVHHIKAPLDDYPPQRQYKP